MSVNEKPPVRASTASSLTSQFVVRITTVDGALSGPFLISAVCERCGQNINVETDELGDRVSRSFGWIWSNVGPNLVGHHRDCRHITTVQEH